MDKKRTFVVAVGLLFAFIALRGASRLALLVSPVGSVLGIAYYGQAGMIYYAASNLVVAVVSAVYSIKLLRERGNIERWTDIAFGTHIASSVVSILLVPIGLTGNPDEPLYISGSSYIVNALVMALIWILFRRRLAEREAGHPLSNNGQETP